ncbi:MAG TPA: iron-sulfur cluster assembly scaffold protein [Gemmatimonadales bacterium]|nr:iron-sulfur cluster assembly scaffold protein [Gemmatimonadales bacterium]
MDRETRIAWLVDHFQHPRQRGALADADVRMPGGNPGCGDVLTAYVRASPGGDRIEALAFEGEGCTLSQAAASILAERVNKQHPTFEDVAGLTYEEMMDLLGRDLVSSRPQCATLALGTLKAAVRRLDMDRRLRAAGRTEEEIRALRGEAAGAPEEAGLVFGDAAAQAAAAGGRRLPDRLRGS